MKKFYVLLVFALTFSFTNVFAANEVFSYQTANPRNVIGSAVSFTLTEHDIANSTITNSSSSAIQDPATDIVFTLPDTTKVGLKFDVILSAPQNATKKLSIKAPTGKYIWLNNVKGATGGNLIFTQGVIGNAARCTTFKSGLTSVDFECVSTASTVTGN